MVLIGPGSRDLSCEPTPHPAYGSELSTGGGRLVRALTAMEAARHPFPVSSTAPHYRRIKSESQEYFWTPRFPAFSQVCFLLAEKSSRGCCRRICRCAGNNA